MIVNTPRSFKYECMQVSLYLTNRKLNNENGTHRTKRSTRNFHSFLSTGWLQERIRA